MKISHHYNSRKTEEHINRNVVRNIKKIQIEKYGIMKIGHLRNLCKIRKTKENSHQNVVTKNNK